MPLFSVEFYLCCQVNCSLPSEPSFFCRQPGKYCLFHMPSDPCETKDISLQHPGIVTTMLAALERYNSTAVPILNVPWDPVANPKYWGYNWVNWKDFPVPPNVDADKLRSEAKLDVPLDYQKLFDFLKPKGHKQPST